MTGSKDPLRYFRVEAREISEELGRGVLQLEKAPIPGLIARLLRLAHTLKGASAVVKQREIAERTHALEDVLAPFRDREATLGKDEFERILAHVDAIAGLVAALAIPAAGPGQPQTALLDDTANVLRADTAEMNAVLESISEAGVQIRALRHTVGIAEQARWLADRLAALPLRQGAQSSAAASRAIPEEMRDAVANLEQALKSGIDMAEREMQQARTAAERLRLLPCSAALSSLERAARDTAVSLGKEVGFAVKGGDVRLDADVLGLVQRALLQLVRNAVVHGIETGEDRAKSGKPTTGRVEIEIVRRGSRVAFVCRDDGRGINLEAVRRAARESGLPSAEMQGLGPDALLRLLLKGGLTTSGVVTELSGRGIGLDIVREVAARLGGEVSAHTRPGHGTDIELLVPASLSSMDALLVEVKGAVSAIPLDAVRRTIRLVPGDVTRTPEADTILHDGEVVTFVPLARLLKRAAPSVSGAKSAVVVAGATAMAAIGIDRLLGVDNIVVQPLPALSFADAMVAGVSLDAEGIPRLVLDPHALVAASLGMDGPEPEPTAAPLPPILVIDDSLTTRVLEQSILESAGYEVDLATSAEEGLVKAKQRRYGLFLVDVEMPGMDGFGFVETIRADPDLRAIPAILVTSRNAPEDQQRGFAAGARAYVVKGEFDQVKVLETIRQFMAQA